MELTLLNPLSLHSLGLHLCSSCDPLLHYALHPNAVFLASVVQHRMHPNASLHDEMLVAFDLGFLLTTQRYQVPKFAKIGL